MKTCTGCKIEKELPEFGKAQGARCLVCTRADQTAYKVKNLEKVQARARASHLKIYYKLTIEQYDAILISQNGACFICKKKDPGAKNGRFFVDHDHACCPGQKTCGKCVRGLLCRRCNGGLGTFEDNPKLLRAAAAYLDMASGAKEKDLRELSVFGHGNPSQGANGPRKNSKSGLRGVFLRKDGKWLAQITGKNLDGTFKRRNLGYFTTPEEAAVAYNRAALIYFGPTAYQNPVDGSKT